MKRNLRLGDCYALTNHRLKHLKITYISLLAVLTSMCLEAQAQVAADTSAAPAALGKDTLDISRDTLQIEEVEINAGYYTVKDRERTGSIGRVDAKTIARQPVSNPLASLHGQIPGVEVTQLSGVPGGNITLRIRGQNSLLNGSDPLYIIDGVPFTNGQQPINQLSNAAGSGISSDASTGISPLSLINPADIASIEILKDADATAIYGSRGANGVVLITTHKAMQQALSINAQYRTGLSRPSRMIDMLSGSQYLAMRREAFANDGIEINATSAPDLVLWDTTAAIDFLSLLLPERARYSDAQLSVRGGNALSNFLISGSYHDESTVFSDRTANRRLGLHSSGSLRNARGNFSITGTVNLTNTAIDLPRNDLTAYRTYTPFLRVYNDDGSLAWDIGGTPYRELNLLDANPLAQQFRQYDSDIFNLTGQVSATYGILPGLDVKTAIGTNMTFNREHNAAPSTAIDPYTDVLPSASFATGNTSGWSIEPQLTYQRAIGQGKLSALVGGTWHHQARAMLSNSGSNYGSDLLLGSIAAAGDVNPSNQNSEYRYQGFYSRLNGSLKDRYFLNLTGRRDGSSRFSPEHRYANFAAVGTAWLLDAEPFMQWATWLDLAKLRASYGITGNDQIGDYRYLDTWTTGTQQYEGSAVLNPVALYNPDYVWERNRKFETALETRVLDNRLTIEAAYFRNISSNQLVQYALPIQTGFSNILRNHQATILNTGWEFQLAYETRGTGPLQWHTAINATLPRNKLLAFQNLETSSYRTRYIVGEAITTELGYQYLGVNPESGVYDFTDVDKNGTFNSTDAIFPVRKDLYLYGGWSNTFSYRQWSLAITVDAKLQDGYNYLRNMAAKVPGYHYYNQPTLALARWQKPGDNAAVQRYTATTGSDAYLRAQRLGGSEAVISDASYARLRNVALAYELPAHFTTPLGLSGCRLSCQGQNLLTITGYEGTDPESQDFYVLPPLRTVVFSLELNF